jgi:hypothetical protein
MADKERREVERAAALSSEGALSRQRMRAGEFPERVALGEQLRDSEAGEALLELVIRGVEPLAPSDNELLRRTALAGVVGVFGAASQLAAALDGVLLSRAGLATAERELQRQNELMNSAEDDMSTRRMEWWEGAVTMGRLLLATEALRCLLADTERRSSVSGHEALWLLFETRPGAPSSGGIFFRTDDPACPHVPRPAEVAESMRRELVPWLLGESDPVHRRVAERGKVEAPSEDLA